MKKCGFYLPECAYYDYLNNAPDTAEKADLVKKAMEAIERESPKMDGLLPKEVYTQLVSVEEPELLSNIVRIFKNIPKNCTVDIFGEIYEYFLGNFTLAEGKDGGTFYTPAMLVQYIEYKWLCNERVKSLSRMGCASFAQQTAMPRPSQQVHA